MLYWLDLLTHYQASLDFDHFLKFVDLANKRHFRKYWFHQSVGIGGRLALVRF